MQNIHKVLLILVLGMLISFPSIAVAKITIGAGGFYSSSPYKRHDASIMPFPLINYEGERFYVSGASAGVYLWKNDVHEVMAGVSYYSYMFDNDKTDDRRLKQLSNRHSTLMAEVGYRLKTKYGIAAVKMSGDILGTSEGLIVDLSYRYPVSYGKFRITPAIGVQWASQKQQNYYYGISHKEAQKSNLSRYKADDGLVPYLGLELGYVVTDGWSIMAAGQVLFLNDEIKDSPMVDASRIFNLMLGVAYTF